MAGNDMGTGEGSRTPGQKGGAADRTPSLKSRSNAGVQIPADYFAQFSRLPDAGYYGYHQTLRRQYPGADMSHGGWGLENLMVGVTPQDRARFGAGTEQPWRNLITPTETDEERKDKRRGETHNSIPQGEGEHSMAYGGLVALAGGGPVQGSGDGLSDSVPAAAGGQEFALSDGEFVIPADVVSGLGNGSSEAGAKRLYDLMNRVRAARTGSEESPAPLDPRAVMP